MTLPSPYTGLQSTLNPRRGYFFLLKACSERELSASCPHTPRLTSPRPWGPALGARTARSPSNTSPPSNSAPPLAAANGSAGPSPPFCLGSSGAKWRPMAGLGRGRPEGTAGEASILLNVHRARAGLCIYASPPRRGLCWLNSLKPLAFTGGGKPPSKQHRLEGRHLSLLPRQQMLQPHCIKAAQSAHPVSTKPGEHHPLIITAKMIPFSRLSCNRLLFFFFPHRRVRDAILFPPHLVLQGTFLPEEQHPLSPDFIDQIPALICQSEPEPSLG